MNRHLQQLTMLGSLALASSAAADAPASRYTFPTAGTVYDTRTKLTWQRDLPDVYPNCSGTYAENYGTPGQACTWDAANAYCVTLALDGGGWRLPTHAELLTLVDPQNWNPAIDASAFPNTMQTSAGVRDRFWTSTPFAQFSGYMWGVEFTYGYSEGYPATGIASGARCVR